MKNFTQSRFRSLLLVPALVGAFALAACGDDEGGDEGGTAAVGGPDPRELVPAGVPIYVEAVVDPDSEQAQGLNAAVARVAGFEDAVGAIEAEIEAGLEAEGSELSYSEDIEPLLGGRAGVFVSDFPEGFTSADAEDLAFSGAAVIATTDSEAALELVKQALEEGGDSFEDASYEDISYIADPDETGDQRGAAGAVGDFLVFGNEAGLQAAVDAQAGENLAGDDEATGDLDALDAASLLSGHFDFGALFEIATASGDIGEEEIAAAEEYFGGTVEGTGTFALGATEDAFTVEFSGPASLQPGYAAGSDAIESLPGNAWLAFAASDVGAGLTQAFEQFEAAMSLEEVSGLEGAPLDLGDIEAEIGLDPATDLAWIGDVRGFVAGESLFGLGGGIAVEATDEAAATDALKALAGTVRKTKQADVVPIDGGFEISSPEAPVTASIVLQDGELVFAAGAVDEEDVLSPAETLGESDSFQDAIGALGDDYAASFFVDLETIESLVESFGGVSADPSLGMALQYLANMDYLIVGSSADEETISAKAQLGLRDGSSSDAEAATIIP